MYNAVASCCFTTLVFSVLLATCIAYPYKNNFHDLRDYDPKDVRNLDGIDSSKLANQDDRTVEKREVHYIKGYTPSYPTSGSGYQSSSSMSQLDGIGGGNLIRDLETGEGGGNLLRDLDILRNRAAMYERQERNYKNLDTISGITLGGQKRSWTDNFNGNDKRNFDEIDRAGFDSFVKKRGFDEIDNVGFDGFVKRNLDEIDRVGFGTFIKRNAPSYPTNTQSTSTDHIHN